VTGQSLPPQTYTVTRHDLIRYAGASGDFNPIHWSQRAAEAAGLPGVIAHGMLTMALGGRAIGCWAGPSGRIRRFESRFTRPLPVPDNDTGITVTFNGTLIAADDGGARIEVTATADGALVAELKATVTL
jgi:acyl dehydratase